MRFLRGIPLFDHIALRIKNLNVRAFKLLAVRDVDLAHADLCLCILNQENAVLGNGSCGRDLSGLINTELSICCNSISVRCYCFAKDILDACLQAFYYMSFLRGIPFLDYRLFAENAFLQDDLDVRAFKLLAVRDVSLAHADLCLLIFDQKHSVLRNGSCGRDLTGLIDRECCVCRDSVAFRCHCLAQRVLHAGLQAFDLMGFLTGCPLFDNLLISFFILLDDLDLSAFELFTVRDVDLAHADLCLCILNQQHAVLGNGSCGRYLAGLINTKLSICCNSISVRCYCLFQCILFAGLQAADLMGFLRGIPLFDNVALRIKDLDMRAFELLAVRDVDLAHADFRLSVLDQEHAVLGNGSCGRYLAALVDAECYVSGDSITFRCHCLFQCVFHTGLQAFDLMRLFAGYPFFNDFALFEDLDRCSFEFLAVCDVDLAHADRGHLIFYQQYSVVRNSSCRSDISFFINCELCICCDSISVRCYRLTKDILDAGLQAFDHVRLCCGIPFRDHFLA